MCKKCDWALKSKSEEMYHDTQWGRPVFDDETLFEMLILEGQQAGLSWSTILNKRIGLKEAYHQFDPHQLSKLKEEDINLYMKDDRVIKHKLKIASVIDNAKAYLKLCSIHGSLSAFLWPFVDGVPIDNQRTAISQIPAQTELSTRISTTLKKLGFKFVGPTTIYAFMQSVGMVNDHLIDCPSYKMVEVK